MRLPHPRYTPSLYRPTQGVLGHRILDPTSRRRGGLLLQHDALRRSERFPLSSRQERFGPLTHTPTDFLLSRALRSSQAGSNFKLSPSHLQLAAQVPAEWMRSEETLHQARLALRKIVWRALIQDVLHPPQEASADSGMPGGPKVRVQGPHDNAVTTEERRSKRLGRLNDAAYAEWETFAHRVRAKLGLHQGTLERADRARERRIEVFHVLRCIVGPVIESLIMLDRAVWVAEELQDTGLQVELVNLFDQPSGSYRNVALVIRPRDG